MNNKYLNSELLYEDGMFNMTRVIELDDGSLFTLACISRQIHNIGTYPKHQFIFSRRSFDGGRTWTMPHPLFEIPDIKAFVRMMPFIVSKEGFLHVFLVRIKVYDFENAKFEGDIMHARMDDITGKNLKIQKIECLDRYTGSLNNLIQIKSGRIVVPFSTLRKGESSFVSNTIYSDDEGTTWKASNDISVISKETHVESGAVEPVIAELSNNKLVMIIRTVLGYFYYSMSEDGGSTWGPAAKSAIKSSNAPGVLQKMNDGKILFVWNNCNGAPMRGVRYSMARQCLHAAVSDDGLKTLKGCRVIVKKVEGDPDGALNCYPLSAVSAENDALIILRSVGTKDNEDWGEPNVKLIKFTSDFLNETEYKNDFAGGLGNWITDYTNSELIEYDEKKALMVKAASDAIGYAMVNFPYGQKGKITFSYKTSLNFTKGRLILSDNYIDRVSFIRGKTDQYKDFIEENYLDIPLRGEGASESGLVIGKGNEGILVL